MFVGLVAVAMYAGWIYTHKGTVLDVTPAGIVAFSDSTTTTDYLLLNCNPSWTYSRGKLDGHGFHIEVLER